MKVHFHVLFPRGASMRCGIELPDPPTGAAIRDVARAFMSNIPPTRMPIWQEDGTEVDLLVMPGDKVGGDELNGQATAMLQASLSRRGAVPRDRLEGHRVYGRAIVVEPKAWPA